MSERPPTVADRADRILDAAGALLLRLGYRKVTIEDIAKQADIGKGTVYLHWRTKEQLFHALLLRESIDLVEELLQQIREDPATIVPHRYARSSFIATLRRPLILALLTGDTELLGKLKNGPLRAAQLRANQHYFELMISRGLLRADVPHIAYTMRASAVGFYMLESFDRDGTGLDGEAKADALAHVIRTAFEPAGEHDPRLLADTAAEFVALLAGVLANYRTWIYEGRTP